ncbi:MAG: YqaJ viral recombinase family protein [Tannerellaceae bacterium]|jgi:hypothetical protein|nr:YqaJ viral recombinase family protein [Tannerellaceae bacterium]
MKQNTPEWHLARLGKFTSSRLGDLLTAGRGKGEMFGQTAMTYINQVAAERKISRAFLSGEGLDLLIERMDISSKSMRWGTDMEPFARDCYEETTGLKVSEAGFIEYNNYFGDSPDGIVYDSVHGKGTLEIKCPSMATHLLYCGIKTGEDLLRIEKGYYAQCQGHIIANNAVWCDFVSYDPMQEETIHIVRIYPDEEMIQTILTRLEAAERIIRDINSNMVA